MPRGPRGGPEFCGDPARGCGQRLSDVIAVADNEDIVVKHRPAAVAKPPAETKSIVRKRPAIAESEAGK
eukprot:4876110-Lingulodinium_polyedra.AAC.1